MSQEMTNDEKKKLIAERDQFLVDIYQEFLKPFPAEALKAVPGPGMTLTSVQPQYIVERLNEVCGIAGWTHQGITKYVPFGDDMMVIFEGELRLPHGVIRRADGAAVIRKSNDVGNAVKSAQTDSFSKCCSKVGLANEVFKGLVAPPGKKPALKVAPKSKGARGDF